MPLAQIARLRTVAMILVGVAWFATVVACGGDGGFVPVDAGIDGGSSDVSGDAPFASCTPDPCGFGTCVDTGSGARCACDLGWGGAACDRPVAVTDHCAQAACGNGVCANARDGFTCVCDLGWGGAVCDEPVDVPNHCADAVCANGDCINTNDGATCRCAWGWAGAACDVPADPCDPDPCQNGACSVASGGVAQCACDPGFDGPRCNIAVELAVCEGVDCGQGACRATAAGPVCDCDDGWGGAGCDVEGADPCAGDVCGNGWCARDGDRAACTCMAGWTGASCDTPIAGASRNPMLRLNDCAVELPALEGWVDNGDGTFTARGPIGFNGGTRLLPLEGTDFTWDEDEQRLTGLIDNLPLGVMGYLSSTFGLPGGTSLSVRVQTGAEINAAAPIRGIPIPDEREVLAFTADAAGASFTLPGTTESVGLDELNILGVYLDPCDPLFVFSMAPDLLAAVTPAQVFQFGGSYGEHLAMDAAVDLWLGTIDDFGAPVTEPVTVRGLTFASGLVSLKSLEIPVTISASLLIGVDPDRNGRLLEDVVVPMLGGQFPDEPLPPTVDDFEVLINGAVNPAIPLVRELAAFLSAGEVNLSLARGAMYLRNTDATGFGLFFRGDGTIDPFEGTPLANFWPEGGVDVRGYLLDAENWGLYYESEVPVFAGLSSVQNAVTVSLRDGVPVAAVSTTANLGTIELIEADWLPVRSIDLGDVPIRLVADFERGRFCGQTGYESADVGCTVEVCIGDDGFEVTPACALPRYAPCASDDQCASGACSGVVPDPVCADACNAIRRDVCPGTCAAGRDLCEQGCDEVANGCAFACRGASPSCADRCSIADAACAGCESAESACVDACGATDDGCDVACDGAYTACVGAECGPAVAACATACVADTGYCGASCAIDDARCVADCGFGPGGCAETCADEVGRCLSTCAVELGCTAARATCRAGCEACIAAPWLCPGGYNQCLNDCDVDFAGCQSGCACELESTCISRCASCVSDCGADTLDCYDGCAGVCDAYCAPVVTACEASCDRARSACAGGCGSVESGCREGCRDTRAACQRTACGASASCIDDCSACVDGCGTPADCYEDTCVRDCDTRCDVERDVCLIACEGVRACE